MYIYPEALLVFLNLCITYNNIQLYKLYSIEYRVGMRKTKPKNGK